MVTVQIEISDQQAAAMQNSAQARGLTMEQYLVQLVNQAASLRPSEAKHADARPIWEVIQDNMKNVPREDLAALPKDGASQIDHYIYGHPKRNL